MHAPSIRRPQGVSCGRLGLIALVVAGAAGADEPAAVRDGRHLFARTWTPKDPGGRGGDGLGPVFNAQSCLACHDQGGPGGAGAAERNIEIITATGAGSSGYGFAYSFGMDLGAGRFEYRLASNPPASSSSRRRAALDPAALAAIHPGFRAARSVLLHRFGVDPGYASWRDALLASPRGAIAVQVSQRNPTPLFGAGLIDAIPDAAIEAASKRKATAASKAIKGRVSRLPDGRIGRFGWKAQTATLAEFVASAAANELGLEVPGHHQAADPRLPGLGASGLDIDQDGCDALVAYVRSLPPPITRAPADDREAEQVAAGAATFRSIGCADCHPPTLGTVDGIYSDLLLHDIGPRLGDTGAYGVFVSEAGGAPGRGRDEAAGATDAEWRTPPLWGLRDSAPYLHDGRATTIEHAILGHAGQGASSSRRFAQLSERRRAQLEVFLLSLAAPPAAGPHARRMRVP